MELSTLLSRDRNTSKGDLERVLRRSGALDNQGSDAVDNKCLEVFSELEARAIAAAQGYPFKVKGGLLTRRAEPADYPVYVFCLCLSFFKWTQSKGQRVFPRRLFEALSAVAAKIYLKGESVLFASPRRELPPRFTTAVDAVCARIGEGGGYRAQGTPAVKDDGVDVIAWKAFADGRASKLLLFGQCASGQELRLKRSELQASVFCQQWMLYSPISPLIHALFIPHCVAEGAWEALGRRSGVIFDRPRLTRLLHRTRLLPREEEYVSWSRTMLLSAAKQN